MLEVHTIFTKYKPGGFMIQATKGKSINCSILRKGELKGWVEITCTFISRSKTHMTWPKKRIPLYFWRDMHIYHVWNALERRFTSNYTADDPDIKETASNQRCHIYARLVVFCLLCRCFSAALKPTLNKWCTAGFGKRAPETEWKVIQRKLRRGGGF